MRTWIETFRPKMVMFVYPCPEDKDAIMVQAVCADRVFRVRHSMAVRKADGDRATLKFLEA